MDQSREEQGTVTGSDERKPEEAPPQEGRPALSKIQTIDMGEVPPANQGGAR